MEQDYPRYHYHSDSCSNHFRGIVLYIMSNSILTSSQYQNYRYICTIVIHCSATRCNRPTPVEAIDAWHRARGFARIGYHYYITRDGIVHGGRPLYQVGAHAVGFNENSIGVCYEGGLDAEGHPCDTRTKAQRATLLALMKRLKEDYPQATILGHRDLPGVGKDCPCFDAELEYHSL